MASNDRDARLSYHVLLKKVVYTDCLIEYGEEKELLGI